MNVVSAQDFQFFRSQHIRNSSHALIDSGFRVVVGKRTLAAVLCSHDQNGASQLVDATKLGGPVKCGQCGAVGSVLQLTEARKRGLLDLEAGSVTVALDSYSALLDAVDS